VLPTTFFFGRRAQDHPLSRLPAGEDIFQARRSSLF
jgi:hypothetical protein